MYSNTTFNDSEFAVNTIFANLTSVFDGQPRDSLYVIIPMTLFYAIIFLTGVIGNVSTCIVIFYNKYMHTATNFYLFSLAVSDLVLLLSALPKEVYELWFRYSYIFGEESCILQGFASESAANATVLTITAFTIERYVAICHPFMSQTVSKLSRAVKHIVIIWLMALCLAIPQAIQFGVVYKSDQSVECTVIPSIMDHAFEISSLVFFVIPMCVISVLYVLIGFRLRSSRLMKKVSPSNFRTIDRQTMKNQTRVIRMLVAVVVAFIICWAPFHAQRLLAIYARRTECPSRTVHALYSILTYISGIFYYMSATINPILYNIMSNRFRRAFKSTFGSLCNCCVGNRQRNHYFVRSRSNTFRTNQFQQSTPRSSVSHKEELALQNSIKRSLPQPHSTTSSPESNRNSGVANATAPSNKSSHEETTRIPCTVRVTPSNKNTNGDVAVGTAKNGKIFIKSSPIMSIKAKLQSIRPLSSSYSKEDDFRYRSVDDLYDSKITEFELLSHSEPLDRTSLL